MSLDAGKEADGILAALSTLGNPVRAENEKRYLKSAMVHYGVTVPLTRKTGLAWHRANPEATRADVVRVAELLWESDVFEARMASAEILKAAQGKLSLDDFPLLERFLREARTWALVDTISTGVCDLLHQRFPESGETLDRWAKDPDFWLRRAALLTLLRPLVRGGGDFERFGRYADSMLGEREFFIRKALGWVLRDTARKRQKLVAGWLAPRAKRASGLTFREAVKHMEVDLRMALQKARED